MYWPKKKIGCQFTVVGKRFEKLNGRIQLTEKLIVIIQKLK